MNDWSENDSLTDLKDYCFLSVIWIIICFVCLRNSRIHSIVSLKVYYFSHSFLCFFICFVCSKYSEIRSVASSQVYCLFSSILVLISFKFSASSFYFSSDSSSAWDLQWFFAQIAFFPLVSSIFTSISVSSTWSSAWDTKNLH